MEAEGPTENRYPAVFASRQAYPKNKMLKNISSHCFTEIKDTEFTGCNQTKRINSHKIIHSDTFSFDLMRLLSKRN